MIDLKKFREEQNISQAEICSVLEIAQPYLSAIENGKRPLNEKKFTTLYKHYGDILLKYKQSKEPIILIDEAEVDLHPEILKLLAEKYNLETKNKGVPYEFIEALIEERKRHDEERKRHGLQEGVQFATLTDIIYQTWAGKTSKEYKKFKGLKKENLRDNMTNTELVLNMLAELSTKQISETSDPETFNEHIDVARRGGNIAREARLKLEEETGKKVVSPLNAKTGLRLNKGNTENNNNE